VEFRIDDDDPSDLALTDDQWIQKWVKDHQADSGHQPLRGTEPTLVQRFKHFIVNIILWWRNY
jgi:hypothetical protein